MGLLGQKRADILKFAIFAKQCAQQRNAKNWSLLCKRRTKQQPDKIFSQSDLNLA